MRGHLFLGILLPVLMGFTLVANAAEFHVAPTGSDTNLGTAASPFATIARAQAAVRSLPMTARRGGPVTIRVHKGAYRVAQPLQLTGADSGTEVSPVLYLAERGAEVRVTGGREVVNWRPVTDPATLKRLPEQAWGRVLVADLKAQGLTDYGKLGVRGFGGGSSMPEAELFYDDQPMTLARWPNQGFATATNKTDDQTVLVNTDRVGRWEKEAEPWVLAYWHHDWAELYEPLAGVKASPPTLLRKQEIKPVYGVTPKQARWYAFNLLAELDSPGEYYLDRAEGRLYFWPPRVGGKAVLSMSGGLIAGEKVSHVTFRGFTFEACRGVAISLRGGTNCQVVGCTIRNTGRAGVSVNGGERHQVIGCDVFFTGEGGISMSGGDRPTLTPARHNVENNHVHHYARRARTYHPAISVGGVGSRIAHNLVHDGPHMALAAAGNDHVVEFNEVHNVVEESGDAGAYYVGRDWTARGNVLRYNYWHDIVGSTGYGGMTVYLDDQHSGHTLHGNVFERCMQTIFIGGGCDNVVTNNLFLGCWKAAHLDNRGMNWQKPATDDPNGELRRYLRAMPYTNALWRARYPTLTGILQDDPGVPKRNVYAGNISAGGKWDDVTPVIRRFQTITNNLAFDADRDWARLVKDNSGRLLRIDFKDPAAVRALGFAVPPVGQMGVYADDRRASWPVRHTVRPVQLPDGSKPKPAKP
jgi:hypothetical protein